MFNMIRSSFVNHDSRIAILDQFHNNQAFMRNNFSFSESLKCLDKKVTKHFVYFYFPMLLSYAGIFVGMEVFFPDRQIYYFEYVMLTVFIHAQAFQLLAYSKLIRFQLKLFNLIITEKLDQNGEEKFRKTILLIFEFAERVNKTFAASLLSAMVYVYLSLLGNLYWFFLCVFEKGYAQMSGKRYLYVNTKANKKNNWAEGILCIYPSVVVILSLGHTNFKVERTLKKTFSKVATCRINTKMKEDIFIFLLRKDFQLNAYRFYNVGFLSVLEVSRAVALRIYLIFWTFQQMNALVFSLLMIILSFQVEDFKHRHILQ